MGDVLMLSTQLRQRIRAMVEKYEQRRSNIIWALNRFPYQRLPREKPRVRVKARSRQLPRVSRWCDGGG